MSHLSRPPPYLSVILSRSIGNARGDPGKTENCPFPIGGLRAACGLAGALPVSVLSPRSGKSTVGSVRLQRREGVCRLFSRNDALGQRPALQNLPMLQNRVLSFPWWAGGRP